MLKNMNSMLDKARRSKYAVPHFNINNLEWSKFILEECNNLKSPVIIGVSESACKYMGGFKTIYGFISGLIEDLDIRIPVVLHLDHGSSYESCKKALEAGFKSVMIDASKYDLNENILITKKVVKLAKMYDASVEAEIGHIGGQNDISGEIVYAKVDDCIKLIKETKIDALAPALGSIHGLYKEEPNLNFSRMNEISSLSNIPLVLHGGSGISNKKIKKAILNGMCKININTELQIAWYKGLKEFIEENELIYDPKKVIGSGEKNLKTIVREKILLLGSNNKA